MRSSGGILIFSRIKNKKKNRIMETTTTTIFAMIVNIIMSIACYLLCIKEIRKSAVMSAYYQAQGTMVTAFSWVSAIATALIMYGLILYAEGFWNTLGWILYWTDTIGMLGTTVALKVAASKQLI